MPKLLDLVDGRFSISEMSYKNEFILEKKGQVSHLPRNMVQVKRNKRELL